ncbi:F0F1 ATP synthase subunit alpha [Donghicola sp.]|uniref:F0F1 ATP synthase subunit alpha n=1 Tax=Donghicola sp. TaxID=1929294 RepID=UPI0025E85566|nr:F0F1 ATP synthase subunit alpha [Donghicola sp.]MCT4578801.1 F0F1 ATP synthase subunit alpha [Donghicola sp.]
MPEPALPKGWLEENSRIVDQAELGPQATPVGCILRLADGIAQIDGLPDAPLGALLECENGAFAFAHSLDRDGINAVFLDEGTTVSVGDRVTDIGDVLRVPVGEALLGRVVDPLGRPLDRGPDIAGADHWPVERPAPTIIERDLVSEPLETGVLVMDSLFALGRGQRELIVGDHATGKTSLAVDAIINQKHSDVICVYVAVGQRASAVERVIDAVRTHGDPSRCIFVVGSAAATPGMQWIAPFAGMTMAEFFRDNGQNALIVIDDLTRHAATHRELALLTREPPGREAYPGDVFYLHARLLERAAKLSPELGGGSLTALPIAQTDAGNLSAYIPTNLISITDGQIVLNSHLFSASQRPAVDVGLSVSRVGGKAQNKALRSVAGRVRLDYAQFQELEMFTRFGGISNERVKAQITRGARIRSLLVQPRYSGLRQVDQVALLAALADGLLDQVDEALIPALRERLPSRLGNSVELGAGPLGADQRAELIAVVEALINELQVERAP